MSREREELRAAFGGQPMNGDAVRSGIPAPVSSDEAELDRLAALSPVEYERVRRATAKRLGMRPAVLDREVSKRRGGAGAKLQGRALSLPEPEPWPEAVDGAELLDSLVTAFRRYAVLETGATEALALWTVHAHAHDAFQVSPRLAITSPVKRCGKSTVLAILSALVPRALPASNVTAAVVFRAVEAARPTLLVDEADTFLKNREELRGILNSGHTKAGAFVIRCVGDDSEPRQFATWAPVAVACIGSLPETLADRSIGIPMRRRAPGERVEKLRLDRVRDALFDLARRCARWAADRSAALAASDPEVSPALHDRAADNWRPLLAIADAAGGEWPARARAAALALSDRVDEDAESNRVRLLGDIRDLFLVKGLDRISSADLCDALAALEDRPWSEWRRGKSISPAQVSRLLAPFDIRPRTVKFPDGTTAKGYRLTDFADAFSRYIPLSKPSPRHFPQEQGPNGHKDEMAETSPGCEVTDHDLAPNSHLEAENRKSDGVTDRRTHPLTDEAYDRLEREAIQHEEEAQ